MSEKNLFDFDFTAESAANLAAKEDFQRIEKELTEERISHLHELAEKAFEQNRMEAFFRIHDEIERLMTEGESAPKYEKPAPILPKAAEPEPGKTIYRTQEITIGVNKVREPLDKIMNSETAAEILRESWEPEDLNYRETMKALYLNRSNNVIGLMVVSVGATDSTLCDPKIIFQGALKLNASGLILCHNHPSGTLKPSPQDDAVTQKIKSGGDILNIKLLDHIILSDKGHYSYMDERRM